MITPTSSNGQPSNNIDSNLYETIDQSDLSFGVDERIIVIKRDDDWWTEQIGDRIGTFPYNYVEKIGNIQEKAIAITSYQTNEEDHLSFEQA